MQPVSLPLSKSGNVPGRTLVWRRASRKASLQSLQPCSMPTPSIQSQPVNMRYIVLFLSVLLFFSYFQLPVEAKPNVARYKAAGWGEPSRSEALSEIHRQRQVDTKKLRVRAKRNAKLAHGVNRRDVCPQ